jgi:hypothetical protein
MFIEWFSWFRSRYDDGGSICLIIDCYSVHRQETIRVYAEDLGIYLLFIPPGITDELQPLDCFDLGRSREHAAVSIDCTASAIQVPQ